MPLTYGEIKVGDEVILKKTLNVKVTSVEIVPCKKRGNKVIVLGKDMDSGAEVRDVKPEGRETYKVGDKQAKKSKTKARAAPVTAAKSAAEYDMSRGSAGAAETVPIRAGEVKKGSYLVMKGHPCKVIEVSISKTGKHGHAKANIFGLDVFTGKKYNEISPTSHNMTMPTMFRDEWQLTDIVDDRTMTLMNEAGTTKEDLDLPRDTSGNLTDLGARLQDALATCPEGKGVFCVVLKAMGMEQVVDYVVKDNA
jgi:translation initiation factor 5A